MKVAVIGTGYVGLVTGTCLAEMGNDVICVDNDAAKIERLRKGEIPIYEPGLEELVRTNTREGRLTFSTSLEEAVNQALICMIAVGTPQGDDGAADLSAVFGVAESIARAMDGYRVIVTKSTVPVGTTAKLCQHLKGVTPYDFAMVSNPEFLKQGAAVDDFLKPDRIIIGADDNRAADIMRELYAPFLRTGNPIILMDVRSAEMTKYVANAFLAMKISFMNEISELCERVGADVDQVRTGISTDTRIGTQFLFPGVGFGGSCFPKDVKALIKTAEAQNVPLDIISAVDRRNTRQWRFYLDKVIEHFGHDLDGKTIALWGLAFKPRTDDMREAPSLNIAEALLAHGAKIQAFDPKAMDTAKRLLGDRISYSETAYGALKGADALLLVTEWNEFRRPDFERMQELMRQPIIFDGRNQYDPDRMRRRGFSYYAIGRPENCPDLIDEMAPAALAEPVAATPQSR